MQADSRLTHRNTGTHTYTHKYMRMHRHVHRHRLSPAVYMVCLLNMVAGRKDRETGMEPSGCVLVVEVEVEEVEVEVEVVEVEVVVVVVLYWCNVFTIFTQSPNYVINLKTKHYGYYIISITLSVTYYNVI